MALSDSWIESLQNTREGIMRGTYLAPCECGYTDQTIQRISEEIPKSKSLIYHHHDGEDELLLGFLQFMVQRFEETVPFEKSDGANPHLWYVLDHVMATPLPEKRHSEAKP